VHRIFYLASAIGAFATILIAFDANALSISHLPNQSSNVTPVAGGCGPGFHRGPYGGCRPNVVGYPAIGYGGVYRGGAYYGRVYRGGVYRRGVYRGGVYRRGIYRGAVYRHRGLYRR
jgi:hypothetical protein